MAIGKLFRTIVVASLFSTSAMAQTSMGDSVTGPFNPGDNYFRFLINLANYHGGMLDSDDKKVYQQALMVMLDNMPVGQTIDWYSQTNPGVQGKIRVIYGYQTTNGYCRVYQSSIQKPNSGKDFQEYACRNSDQTAWQFYNK